MASKPYQWLKSYSILITLAAVVAANIAGVAWWSSALTAQAASNKEDIATNTRHVEGLNAGQREIAEALSEISGQMKFLLIQYGQLVQSLKGRATHYEGYE